MATLRQYFEMDFPQAARFHVSFEVMGRPIEARILYDFNGYFAFFSCYMAGDDLALNFFKELVRSLDYGKTQFKFDGHITLPDVKQFPGRLHIQNDNPPLVLAQFFGDTGWVSTRDIQASRRIFIYSETDLSETEVNLLKTEGSEHQHEVQFRSKRHLVERSQWEKPLAFISHDTRDKDEVAKPIAVYLQNHFFSVWYDEFSLKVGDHLRESIEKGLKEYKRCVLVLSPNFLANTGWTKVEFNSIFTREILEDKKLVLPVLYKVSKEMLFDYSTTLINVVGLDWSRLGAGEVCRRLHQAITQASLGSVLSN
jgi:TIR domain